MGSINHDDHVNNVEVRLAISSEEELAPFLACLALGTLQAIRDNIISADVGIWGLTPIAIAPNAKLSSVPPGIVEVYKVCDELALLRELSPEAFDALTAKLIAQLRTELSALEDHNWHFYWGWETDDKTDSETDLPRSKPDQL